MIQSRRRLWCYKVREARLLGCCPLRGSTTPNRISVSSELLLRQLQNLSTLLPSPLHSHTHPPTSYTMLKRYGTARTNPIGDAVSANSMIQRLPAVAASGKPGPAPSSFPAHQEELRALVRGPLRFYGCCQGRKDSPGHRCRRRRYVDTRDGLAQKLHRPPATPSRSRIGDRISKTETDHRLQSSSIPSSFLLFSTP